VILKARLYFRCGAALLLLKSVQHHRTINKTVSLRFCDNSMTTGADAAAEKGRMRKAGIGTLSRVKIDIDRARSRHELDRLCPN
jgi:hypothetical protein